MSANQIIHPAQFANPGLPLGDDDWPGRQRPHGCRDCLYWGGPGHTLAELLKLTRHERETTDENPIIRAVKTCTYWSARKQKHCAGTEAVQTYGSIGPRCVAHIPTR